jgi:hypothetical protein
MDKRIQFGTDCLNLMWELITVTNNQDPVAWACTKMFLIDWGFNSEEIQQIISLYDKQANSMKSMSNDQRLKYGNDSSSRLINFIGSNQYSKERLLVQSSAIAGINLSLEQLARRFMQFL